MDNLEKKVTDAILQRASDTITIDGVEYPITPPTPATLILVSELVSTMPNVNPTPDNILLEVLSTAKDLSVIGKVAATLILGAKRIKENRKVAVKIKTERRWSWRKFRFVDNSVVKEALEVDYLAERIINEVTTETLYNVVLKRLAQMQLGDFFQLTTSLSAANQLKRTKEVVATASGE